MTATYATPGTPRAGSFRYHFDGERWEWSPETAAIFGYSAGEVVPTTDLVLRHRHPDDHGHLAETLHDVTRADRPFAARHRIIDRRNEVHEIVVVGDRTADDRGNVTGTAGYIVDVPPTDPRAHQQSVTEAVAEITENRGGIEQAKGMLMLVYRIDAASAFDLLKWRSQATNVKLRALCEQIVSDFLATPSSDELPARAAFDQLLLTAHERVKELKRPRAAES